MFYDLFGHLGGPVEPRGVPKLRTSDGRLGVFEFVMRSPWTSCFSEFLTSGAATEQGRAMERRDHSRHACVDVPASMHAPSFLEQRGCERQSATPDRGRIYMITAETKNVIAGRSFWPAVRPPQGANAEAIAQRLRVPRREMPRRWLCLGFPGRHPN